MEGMNHEDNQITALGRSCNRGRRSSPHACGTGRSGRAQEPASRLQPSSVNTISVIATYSQSRCLANPAIENTTRAIGVAMSSSKPS